MTLFEKYPRILENTLGFFKKYPGFYEIAVTMFFLSKKTPSYKPVSYKKINWFLKKIPNGEIVVKKISGQNFTAKIHPKIPGIDLPEKKQPPKIPIPKKEVACGISKIQCIILRETSNLGHFRPKGPAWANLGNPRI